MQNERFYEYNDKYTYDLIIRRKIEEGMITVRDGELITKYIKDKLNNGQIEERRANRLSTSLTQWRRFLPEYEKMTHEDLLEAINAMKRGKTQYGKFYTSSTQRGMIKTIKTFANYLRKKGILDITRDQLDEIKPPKEVFDSIKPSELLRYEHFDKIIANCFNMRDKAIVSILAETGLRPVDIGGLKWRDLDINRGRVKVTVTVKKTNTLITDYLVIYQGWLKEHQKDHSGDKSTDYVFVEHDTGKPMTYKGITHVIERAAERAGIKLPKGAKSKLFRASSITNDIRDGHGTVTISKRKWGTPDSKSLRHYAKLVDEDTEKEVMAKRGAIEIPQHKPRRPDTCPECGEPLPPDAKFCPECNFALTKEASASKKEAMKSIAAYLQDPEVLREFLEFQRKKLEASGKDQP